MPIYEFYCDRCRTVFNFFARRVGVARQPACPECGRPRLRRWVSNFAVPSGRKPAGGEDAGNAPNPGDARMEQALERLAGEAESIPDDDPRQAAALMRRFSDLSGMPLTGGMREALERMEKGEDPERVEEEMAGAFDDDDGLPGEDMPEPGETAGGGRARAARPLRPIRHAQTLYELI